MQRFAEFYDGEDAEAQNYDPAHRIIRSLWNGSRGPTMRLPTVDEWDGPGVPGQNPLRRTRFVKVTSITGDHPLNLGATNLAMTAYVLTGEQKYRKWLLEYVDAWRDRTAQNGGNIPSNIGLDGTIGGEAGGKWYGGVFGWSSVETGERNYVLRGPPEGFGNALMLTGAYAEHLATSVKVGGKTAAVNAPNFEVRLAPGAGETLTIGLRRYARQPTLRFPWEQ